MSLNWLGALTNSFRALLASSITAIKSPTLKPKLIVALKRRRHCRRGMKLGDEKVVVSRLKGKLKPRTSRGSCCGVERLRPRRHICRSHLGVRHINLKYGHTKAQHDHSLGPLGVGTASTSPVMFVASSTSTVANSASTTASTA
jgi:hypothetical protein